MRRRKAPRDLALMAPPASQAAPREHRVRVMLEPRRPISEIASLLASLTPDRPSFNATLFASVEKPKRAVASFVRDNDGLIDAMERMIGTWPTVAHGGGHGWGRFP